MDSPDFKQFAACALDSADTRAKRIIAFVYFRSKYTAGNTSLSDLKDDYAVAGLGGLASDIVRKVLKKDSRVRRVGADVWMIPADRFTAIEQDLGLDRCLPTAIPVSAKASARRLPAPKRRITGDAYIDAKRIKELKGIRSTSFDLSRLLAMCDEVNDNAPKNHIATILLVRAILDHVPPIFSSTTFKEVANNFGTTKSIKASLQHLENSSRTIADTYLHTPIRKKETLPNKTQVKFSQDLDVLLAEIVRILSI